MLYIWANDARGERVKQSTVGPCTLRSILTHYKHDPVLQELPAHTVICSMWRRLIAATCTRATINDGTTRKVCQLRVQLDGGGTRCTVAVCSLLYVEPSSVGACRITISIVSVPKTSVERKGQGVFCTPSAARTCTSLDHRSVNSPSLLVRGSSPARAWWLAHHAAP